MTRLTTGRFRRDVQPALGQFTRDNFNAGAFNIGRQVVLRHHWSFPLSAGCARPIAAYTAARSRLWRTPSASRSSCWVRYSSWRSVLPRRGQSPCGGKDRRQTARSARRCQTGRAGRCQTPALHAAFRRAVRQGAERRALHSGAPGVNLVPGQVARPAKGSAVTVAWLWVRRFSAAKVVWVGSRPRPRRVCGRPLSVPSGSARVWPSIW